MDLSTLSIRELFAELTTVENALQGRTEQRLSPSRRQVLEQHQDRLCQELRSRPLVDTFPVPKPQASQSVPGPVPAEV